MKGLGDLAQEHLHVGHVDRGGTLVTRSVQPGEIPVHLSDSLEVNDEIHPRDGVLPVHRSERVVRVLGRLREVKSVKHVEKLQEGRINIVVRVFDVRHGVQEKLLDGVQRVVKTTRWRFLWEGDLELVHDERSSVLPRGGFVHTLGQEQSCESLKKARALEAEGVNGTRDL